MFPPRNVIRRYRVYSLRINLVVHYHQVPPRAGVSEDHGPTGGAAYVFIRHASKYSFNFFLGDAMRGAMLYIPIGVIIKIPNNRLECHSIGSTSTVEL